MDKMKSKSYYESPEIYEPKQGETSVFLAGGITDCPDWQARMAKHLSNSGLIVLNPRRANFPVDDPDAAPAQIKWEFVHLRLATIVLFWFCAETLNPIVLYELGAWSMTDKPIFVGSDPDYERIQDVKLQTKLARPDVDVVHSLEHLAAQVEQWKDRQIFNS